MRITTLVMTGSSLPLCSFEGEFPSQYQKWIEFIQWAKTQAGENVNLGIVPEPPQIKKALIDAGRGNNTPPLIPNSIYIPTGKSFFSIPNKGFAALSVKNLDWITQRYALHLTRHTGHFSEHTKVASRGSQTSLRWRAIY